MEQYSIYYDNSCIAVYYRDDKAKEYSYYVGYPSVYRGKVPDKYLRDHEKKTPFRPMEELMTEENRVAGTRKLIYQHEHIRIVRVPRDTEHFAVYPESVKLECIKMLKTCMKSRVSGILSYIFSAPIWCKFKHRKF